MIIACDAITVAAVASTTRGSVAVPAGLSAAACQGSATITVLAGRRTVVDRSVPVGADCSFSSRVAFAAPRSTRAVRVKVTYGGAPLLGVDGVALICHRGSNAKAIKNAILVAHRFAQIGLGKELTSAIAQHGFLWEPVLGAPPAPATAGGAS